METRRSFRNCLKMDIPVWRDFFVSSYGPFFRDTFKRERKCWFSKGMQSGFVFCLNLFLGGGRTVSYLTTWPLPSSKRIQVHPRSFTTNRPWKIMGLEDGRTTFPFEGPGKFSGVKSLWKTARESFCFWGRGDLFLGKIVFPLGSIGCFQK